MTDTTQIAAEVVAAYVAKNSIAASELPSFIQAVFAAFANLDRPKSIEEAPSKPVPAVPIKKSVTPDHIICLEDGKKFRSLKRHLSSAFSMTPDQYRAKWGLPSDYPMVAPAYSERRSAVARSSGLGRRAGEPAGAPAMVEEDQVKTEDQIEVDAAVELSERFQEAPEAVQDAA